MSETAEEGAAASAQPVSASDDRQHPVSTIYENDSRQSLVSVALSSAAGGTKTPLLEFVSFSIVDTERRMTETISLKDYYTVFLIETK